MLGNTRLLALCTSAALVLSAECNPDSPTQISGIGYYAEPGECNDPEVWGPTMTSS
jgi:hypothetical protein